VYESTLARCAHMMIGYLLVRGGLHVVAYAKVRLKFCPFTPAQFAFFG